MNVKADLLALAGSPNPIFTAINRCLARAGASITREDALVLAERRTEILADVERVEFGTPAVVAIAEAVATSPCLPHNGVAKVLAGLQDAFYALRDELPIDVPDEEIVEALRNCLEEVSDASEIKAMPSDELMSYSKKYMHALDAEREVKYRIVDDDGRAYTFDPDEWDYDECADGWDGERWADAWDD